jgi:hypothetical protein
MIVKTNSFVGVVEQQHNTRGTNATQGPPEQGIGASHLERRLWRLDIYLWLVFGVAIVIRESEEFFGVLSGFTLLMGPYPAMVLTLVLIFGGAAGLLNLRMPQLPAGKQAPAFASETDAFTVRTAPRPAPSRSRASRRVMDMEI